MIGFRYHLVSTAAVLFALAAGIVLGTTELSGPILDGLHNTSASLTRNNQALTGQVSSLTTARAADQQFIARIAPLAAAGRLSGRTVAVVSAPGVSVAQRAGVLAMLHGAGALVSADIRIAPAWVDPSREPLLSSLAGRLAATVSGSAGGNGPSQAASELADVLVARPGASAQSGANITDVLSAYQQAGLLQVAATPTAPASLAVLLVPARLPGGAAGGAATDVLDIGSALSGKAVAAVLAGPTGGTSGQGALSGASGLPQAPHVLAGDDTPAGQLSLVLTLANSAATG